MKKLLITAVLVVLLFILLNSLANLQQDTVDSNIVENKDTPFVNPVLRPSYTMQLTLDCEANRLHGNVHIVFENNSQDEWDKICIRDFNAGAASYFAKTSGTNTDMKSGIDYVKNAVNGHELFWERDSDVSVVWVVPEKPLPLGTRIELDISFYSDIPYNYDFISQVNVGDNNSFFEFGNFYPILAIYEDEEWQTPPYAYQTESFYSLCADYNVLIRLPSDYLVISTGSEEKMHDRGGISVWQLNAENVRDFAITAANNLAKIESNVGNTTLNTYYYKNEPTGLNTQHEANLMQESAQLAFALFEQKIGAYPYDELDIVLSFGDYGGLEYPGLVRISIKHMDFLNRNNSSKHLEERYAAIKKTTAHEVAHQWFYAVVGNNSYSEPWLDEAFASFCERYIYLKTVYNADEFDVMVKDERAFIAKWQDNIDKKLDLPVSEYNNFYYSVYVQGALFLHDIMQLMGEDAFFAMLSDYYAEYSFKQANTVNFLQTLYKHTQDSEVWGLVAQHIAYLPAWAKELI